MSKPLSYYLGLVTSEYQNSPKFLAWLTGYLNHAADTTDLLDSMDADFDIDNAVGVQLDTIGVILGLSRTVNFDPTDGSSAKLNDTYYRIILKARVLINQWDGQTASLISEWKVLFPDIDIIIFDNQDMTFNVTIVGTVSQLLKDLFLNGYIIPKPQGVNINYTFGSYVFFGYGFDNDYISGYGRGIWIGATEHPEFAYDEENVTHAGYDVGYWKE